MRKSAAKLLAIFAATLAAYVPALSCAYIWDDDLWLLTQKLATLSDLALYWFSPGHFPQYYPLVHTTFFLEEKLWGLSPMGFHAVNIALHALCAVLIWRCLARLRVPGAFLGGLLFALHPICVESVAWVTERKNVLSGAFFFASLLLWVRFFELDDRKTAHGPLLWLAGFLLFCCAVLSKTVTVTLPAVVVMLIFYKRGRIGVKDLALLVPLFLVSAASAFQTVHMEQSLVGAQGAHWDMPFSGRLMLAGRTLWFYAGRIFLPHDFIFIYPRFVIRPENMAGYLWPASALLVVTGLFLLRKRMGRGPFTAVACFAGVLFPALGFFNVFPFLYSYVADHFAYHASAFLMALAAAGIARAIAASRGCGRVFVYAGTAALLVFLGVQTFFLCFSYKDEETLWKATLAKNPGAWIADNNLGAMCLNRGDFACAESHILAAIGNSPTCARAYSNLGGLRLRQGKQDEAEALFKKAIELDPDLSDPQFNMASLMESYGNKSQARRYYLAALRPRPDFAFALSALAANMEAAGNRRGAIPLYAWSLEMNPDLPQSLLRLGVLSARAGQNEQAKWLLRRYLKKDPENVQACFFLGAVLLFEKNYQEAASPLSTAASLMPDNARAAEYLGICFLGLQRLDLAVANLSRAAELEPDNLELLSTLAQAYAASGEHGKAEEIKARIAAVDPNYALPQAGVGK